MRNRRILVAAGMLWLGLNFIGVIRVAHAAPPAAGSHSNGRTPLDDYIAKPDPAYSWKVVNTIPGDGFTAFVVDMKSQTWRATPEVNRPVWRHWLTIIKPDVVKHDTAFLRIGGGKNGDQAPERPNSDHVLMAKATGTVVADLGMVPNQPLIFNGDGQPRSEDDLIAYCQIKFMDTGDPTWLPRLPMVKSAVRAMDTITALLASDKGGKTEVKKFVVAGGSKRGWTTWLTGAADSRVVAIIPIVIDVVNVRVCKMNHYAAYGFWAPAVGDYTRHKVHERFDTPQYAELLRIVEPVFLSRPAHAPEVHHERLRRSVFPARLVQVLFRRPQGREIPALCPERQPLAQRVGRCPEHPDFLPGDPERLSVAPIFLEGPTGRSDPCGGRRQAH